MSLRKPHVSLLLRLPDHDAPGYRLDELADGYGDAEQIQEWLDDLTGVHLVRKSLSMPDGATQGVYRYRRTHSGSALVGAFWFEQVKHLFPMDRTSG